LNTVLSYIAGIIALLLVAALAGPSFVDWNQFRDEFEAQAGKITGREVTIGGDISLVVLPAPHLTLNNVSVANEAGGEHPDFLRVGRVEVEVAFAPLLRGEISATSVEIARPQFHLEVAPDGGNNWDDLVSLSLLRENGFFAPSSVSLEKVSFEEGIITFSDRRSDKSWKVEHLNGDVVATSLVGPMRADMSLQVNQIPFVVRVGVGNFSNNKAFKITTEIESPNAPAKLLFSGISTSFSSDARVDGTASLEIGSTKSVDGEPSRAPLRVEAGIVSTGDTATLRNLIVAMAGTRLKGNARINWRDRPNVSVTLVGEALTLDPLADRFGDLLAGGKVPYGGILDLPLPDWMDGRAKVTVDGLLTRDVLIRNAFLDMVLKNGVLTLDQVKGEVPGGTRVALSGALKSGDVSQFDGKLSISSENLSGLSLWLETVRDGSYDLPDVIRAGAEDKAGTVVSLPLVSEDVKPDMKGRPFAFVSHVVLAPDRFALRDFRAAYAVNTEQADLSGNVVLIAREADRLLMSVKLDAKTFDVDPLFLLLPESVTPKSMIESYDYEMAIKAERLKFDTFDVAGLDVAAQFADDTLKMQRFHADNFAGAALDANGTLSGVSDMRIDALTGVMNGTVKAEQGGAFFKFLGPHADGLDGLVDLNVAFSSGKAVDSEAAVDTLTIQGVLSESRVDAVMKRQWTNDDAPDAINLVANAANVDGRVLLHQLGYDASEALLGAGSASLQMSGNIGNPMDTSFRLNVGGATFTAKGDVIEPLGARAFSGRADISASDVATVSAALGAPEYLSDFVVAQAAGPSFVFSANVKSDAGQMVLDNAEIVTGRLHVSGDVTYTSAADEKPARISGKVESNLLDLTSIAGDSGGDALAWSPRAINLAPMSLFEGEMDWQVGKLTLGTLQFDNANMHVSLADDVMSVTPFAARMAGGNAAFTARIEGGKVGEPGIGLTLNLAGSELSELGQQLVGTSFASGKVNLALQAEAQGRSWLALVSSINGIGQISVNGAKLAPLDVGGFARALEDAKSVDQLAGLKADVLTTGQTNVQGLDGEVTIKDGLARMSRDALVLDGGKARLTAMYDFSRLAVDSELDVMLDQPADAPGFSDVSSGRIGSVMRRVDVTALQQFAAQRILAQSVKDAGLDSLPDELSKLIGGTGKAADNDNADGSAANVPVPIKRPVPR
tara:strand:+ start:40105 stop:43647 length:3543 start_codon:yes stop_codon:yes gene_type:complete